MADLCSSCDHCIDFNANDDGTNPTIQCDGWGEHIAYLRQPIRKHRCSRYQQNYANDDQAPWGGH